MRHRDVFLKESVGMLLAIECPGGGILRYVKRQSDPRLGGRAPSRIICR